MENYEDVIHFFQETCKFIIIITIIIIIYFLLSTYIITHLPLTMGMFSRL